MQVFLQNPSTFITSIQQFLEDRMPKNTFNDLLKVHNTIVQIKSIPYLPSIYKEVKQITSDDIGQWIILTGTIIQCTQKKTIQKNKLFTCDKC